MNTLDEHDARDLRQALGTAVYTQAGPEICRPLIERLQLLTGISEVNILLDALQDAQALEAQDEAPRRSRAENNLITAHARIETLMAQALDVANRTKAQAQAERDEVGMARARILKGKAAGLELARDVIAGYLKP